MRFFTAKKSISLLFTLVLVGLFESFALGLSTPQSSDELIQQHESNNAAAHLAQADGRQEDSSSSSSLSRHNLDQEAADEDSALNESSDEEYELLEKRIKAYLARKNLASMYRSLLNGNVNTQVKRDAWMIKRPFNPQTRWGKRNQNARFNPQTRWGK